MDSPERWRGQGREDPGMACQLGRYTPYLVSGESCAYEGVGIAPVCRRAGWAAAGAAVAAGHEHDTVRGVCTGETLHDLAGFAIDGQSLTSKADGGRTTGSERGGGGGVGNRECAGSRTRGGQVGMHRSQVLGMSRTDWQPTPDESIGLACDGVRGPVSPIAPSQAP